MICAFNLYPDELLFSGCSRYGASMDYPNKNQAINDCFGKGASALVDLSGRLDHFLRSLPPSHLYTADELIDKHTTFPFYAPFLPKGRARQIRKLMRSNNSKLVAQIPRTCHGKKPNCLRFCPECASEDRVEFKETYWHRLHQLHGVNACSRHDVFLEETDVMWHCHTGLKPADDFVRAIPPRKLDYSNFLHAIHGKIARIASFLLSTVRDSLDSEIMAHRYRNLLLRDGLGYCAGQVRTTMLIDRIRDYYPEDFLTDTGCNIRSGKSWVNRLVSTRQTRDKQHPVCHILLSAVVTSKPEEVFDEFVEYKPFGEGPWPCLNPVRDHYRKSCVRSCKVVPGAKKDAGMPRGIFTCSCGFTYARTGPDTCESDRFTYTIVQAYGKSWEDRLRQLWVDRSYEINTIATTLGVSVTTVKRRVVVLGLHFRRFKKGLASKKRIPDRYRLRRASKNVLLEKKKQECLQLLAKHPKAGRSELWDLSESLLLYIRRADPQWLEEHLPPRKQHIPRRPAVDWQKEDVLLAKAVKDRIAEILGSHVPTRISAPAIATRTGQLNRLRFQLDKLPQTAALLDAHLESTEDFLERRIRWVEDSFRKEGRVPTKFGFAKRAQIRRYVSAKNGVVVRAMEEALLRLGSNPIAD
jgi:Tn7-like transposition protein D/TniQ protein